jgi:hypothetical protein
MTDSPPTAAKSGVNLRLCFWPFSLILWLCTPSLSIDGLFREKMSWGTEFVPLSAGRHTFRCMVHLLHPNVGNSMIEFEVPADSVIDLQWKAPVFASGRGKWTILATG